MSEQPEQTEDPTATTPPAHEGLLEEALSWLHHKAAPVQGDAEKAATAAGIALDHASSALPIVAKILQGASMVDPSDQALWTLFQSLVPEALEMAGKVTSDAAAVLKA